MALLLLVPLADASGLAEVERLLSIPPDGVVHDLCGAPCSTCVLCNGPGPTLPDCVVGIGLAKCWATWMEETTFTLVCMEGSGLSTRVGYNLKGPSSGCTMLGP